MATPHPDVILYNGKITTLVSGQAPATAIAFKDGKVAAVGEDHAIRQAAGSDTKVINLNGRRVIPGLNDSHLISSEVA